MSVQSNQIREPQLERIRNKPVAELTTREIEMLTPQEQRWVWDYRNWLKQTKESK